MGKATATERVRVSALTELDALVAQYLTGETPRTHWEDSHARLQFDSVEEALEALREPYFQKFIPEGDRANTFLQEVLEFRPYSSDISATWDMIAQISDASQTMHVRRDCGGWQASFGDRPYIGARTAPIAICLAGLRSRGIEVDFITESSGERVFRWMHQGSLGNELRMGTLAG